MVANQIFIDSNIKFKNFYTNFKTSLSYQNFSLESCCANLSRLCIPKIKINNSVIDVPDLKLTFDSCRFVCEDISIHASITNDYIDTSNDLYDFYLYLYSYFNLDYSEIQNISGLTYNSNDYIFKFLNLEKKLNLLPVIDFPTGSFSFIKSGTISGYYDGDIFPFKFCSGSYNSYASIILNKIEYCQNLNNNLTYFEKNENLSRVNFGKDFNNQNLFLNGAPLPPGCPSVLPK
jgi:hypothetical protein